MPSAPPWWDGSASAYHALGSPSRDSVGKEVAKDKDKEKSNSSDSSTSGGSSRYGGYSGKSRTKETLVEDEKETSSSSDSDSSGSGKSFSERMLELGAKGEKARQKQKEKNKKKKKKNSSTSTTTTVDTSDADSSAGSTTSPPDFADDASFGGSGDDHVVQDPETGGPLLADTENAADWLRDQLQGNDSVDEDDPQGTVPGLNETVSDAFSGGETPSTDELEQRLDELLASLDQQEQQQDQSQNNDDTLDVELLALVGILVIGGAVVLGGQNA